jgi:type 1 fimbria pilin
VAFITFIFAVSLSWSQTGTSTIRGTVTDPQGRVVSSASVRLTDVETNACAQPNLRMQAVSCST